MTSTTPGTGYLSHTRPIEELLLTWRPTPVTEFQWSPRSWIWEGFLLPRAITLLSGPAKAGKSTLLTLLVRALTADRPTEFITGTRPVKVLIVSEEDEIMWAERSATYGLTPHLSVICAPFTEGAPSQDDWITFVFDVARIAEHLGAELVIFDTFAAVSPQFDENDASEMINVLTPLRVLSKTGLAVLLVHHHRKSGGHHGKGARGSSALLGWVDISMDLDRQFEGATDARRNLEAISRFGNTGKLMIELSPDFQQYELIAQKLDSSQKQGRLDQITGILNGGPPQTLPEIQSRTAYGERTVKNLLDELLVQGVIERLGAGVKNDPYQYHLKPPLPL